MKKMVFLVFLILLKNNSYSQDSVLLAMHYKPLTDYYQDVVQSMIIGIKTNSPDSTKSTMNDMDGADSTEVNNAYVISGVLRTGELNVDNEMPVTFEYLNSKNQDSTELIPAGLKLYGKINKDDKSIYDSVSQTPGAEKLGPSVLKTTQSLMSQVSFPNKKMAVGDTFTKQGPLTLSVGGINITMKYVQTYKLISATKDSANFAINFTYTAQVNADDFPDMKLTGGGTGEGSLILDRKNEYPVSYDFNIGMKLAVKKNDLSVDESLAMHHSMHVRITPE